MRTELLCISVLRVASGSRVKLASCKSALNPPMGDSAKCNVIPEKPVLVMGGGGGRGRERRVGVEGRRMQPRKLHSCI